MLRAGLDLRDVFSKGLQRDETFTTLVGEALGTRPPWIPGR